jgi:hypothetical protein
MFFKKCNSSVSSFIEILINLKKQICPQENKRELPTVRA